MEAKRRKRNPRELKWMVKPMNHPKKHIQKFKDYSWQQFRRTRIAAHMCDYATSAPHHPPKSPDKRCLCKLDRGTVWYRVTKIFAYFDLIKALTGLKHSNPLENYENSIPKGLSTSCAPLALIKRNRQGSFTYWKLY